MNKSLAGFGNPVQSFTHDSEHKEPMQRKIIDNTVTIHGKKIPFPKSNRLDVTFKGRDYMVAAVIDCGPFGRYAVFSEFKRVK